MSEIANLHRRAMEFADSAMLAKLAGRSEEAEGLFRLAFESELKAATALVANLESEPTRSVLFRSAASLALDCGEIRESEKLIATALMGNPPSEIADELRDLLERVNFRRHLSLKGLMLGSDEFQFAMAGKAIGLGIAENDEFFLRAQFTEKIFARAAARKLGKPYGRRLSKTNQEEVRLYVSQPRAASFAVTFRVGYATQMSLPGLKPFAEELVDDVLTCFELFDRGEDVHLQGFIGDPSYYNNFVQMAHQMSPDGEDISTIGFSVVRNGEERQLSITRPQSALPLLENLPDFDVAMLGPETKRQSVRGYLKYANSLRDNEEQIKVVDETGKATTVIVPKGLMDDIVRPMWDYEVEVSGPRRRGKIFLEDIKRVHQE